MHRWSSVPPKQGLYDPAHEHEACGMGFLVDIKGRRSHELVRQALTALKNMTHRGACGCDPLTGDGSGILIQLPHEMLRREALNLGFELPEPGSYGLGMLSWPPKVSGCSGGARCPLMRARAARLRVGRCPL